MKVFIRASACISPQKTFNDDFLNDVAQYTDTRLPAIEPDYKEFIDPKQIRRMSRVIKMGVTAAKKCLHDAGLQMPGAIVTGTAFGCLEDTVTFLPRMISEREELLPPTAFIQSTHNTVAAQIALSLQCNNYNLTYVHKGISFESALLDGMMLLAEGEATNVLVGATEEMVDAGFKVLMRLGLYKRHPVSNSDLFKERSKGTIGGEGAAFFLLEARPSANSMAELTALKVLYKPRDIEACIAAFLRSYSLEVNDIGLVLTGRNGDIYNDEIYDALGLTLFKDAAIANYKHLCGEYPVSSSFALWLAVNIIQHQTVPQVIMEKGTVNAPKKILIYNHYQQKYHSLMLVSSVN